MTAKTSTSWCVLVFVLVRGLAPGVRAPNPPHVRAASSTRPARKRASTNVCTTAPSGFAGTRALSTPMNGSFLACKRCRPPLNATPRAQDLVLLQEVWVDSDAEVLMSAAKLGGLPYAIHFRSGVFGSGLLTLSRCVGVRSTDG